MPHKGVNLITTTLFLVLALVFFSFSYLAPSSYRMYLIGASLIPFALMMVGLIKNW
jgi:hypothetical protein